MVYIWYNCLFKKILLLQPEKLHQRWQVRSIGRIIQKLVHVGNTKNIKFYGTRLFLIWYQILNTNKTHVEELMFQKLIQGFDTFHMPQHLGSTTIDLLSAEAQKVFTSSTDTQSASAMHIGKSICPFEINPIIPMQEQQPSQSQPAAQGSLGQQQSQQTGSNISNMAAEMLEKILECMQQDVSSLLCAQYKRLICKDSTDFLIFTLFLTH